MTLAEARARLEQLVELGLAGVALVRVVPGAQREVAARIAEGPSRTIVALEALDAPVTARVLVAAGTPRPRDVATAALARFNGMRDRLRTTGALVVLVLDRWELADLQAHAGDVYASQLLTVEVPFEPDAGVDVEAARRAHAARQRERIGRLDLRGFVRAEGEDVAWTVEDLFQQVTATASRPGASADDPRVPGAMVERPATQWLTSRDDRLTVVLGHPGSGKTFLLRWLALTMGTSASFADIQRPVPVVVSLAAWASTPGPVSLLEFVIESLLLDGQPLAHVLAAEAHAGRVVFLLDGLDEAGDASARARVALAIRQLCTEAPWCRVVATSRLAGFEAEALPDALLLTLSALGDDAIRAFLVRWCELYEVERVGDTPDARRKGREEGEALANDVVAHGQVRGLAGSPLLLTVIAIVHRAGVRLPDHRVELYDHATKVLVERWNRVRSLTTSAPAPPIRTADAVRLLGPVALAMIRDGARDVVREEQLRAHLGRALEGGAPRGLGTADEAIGLFRNTLGLLVEQAPGVYAFAHLTLAEYFAAWELVRTDGLEQLAGQETTAFRPEWREVILLALGVLGVLRADDARLDRVVRRLMASASRRKGRPSPVVPSLFGGLLADDPSLSDELIDAVVNFLVPTWWFDKQYSAPWSMDEVVRSTLALTVRRLRNGRAFKPLSRAVARAFGEGPTSSTRRNLSRTPDLIRPFLVLMFALDVDDGPSRLAFSQSTHGPQASRHIADEVTAKGGSVAVTFVLSVWIYEEIQRGALDGRLSAIEFFADQTHKVVACDADMRDATWSSIGFEHYVSVTCRGHLAEQAAFKLKSHEGPLLFAHVTYSRATPVEPAART